MRSDTLYKHHNTVRHCVAGNPRAVDFSIIPDPGWFFVVGTLDSIRASTSPLGGSGCSSTKPGTALGPVLQCDSDECAMCGPALVLEMAVGAVDQHLIFFRSSVDPSLDFILSVPASCSVLSLEHCDVSLTQTSGHLPSQHHPSIGLTMMIKCQCRLQLTTQKSGWKYQPSLLGGKESN